MATWPSARISRWRALFDFAHFCVAARPGYTLTGAGLPAATPHGRTCVAPDLAPDISATQIRAALQRGDKPDSLVSPLVLDYIEQHNLYKN
ncbi:MAG: hypothetical protein V4724_23915 [Pseudomonadota bacterium]